MQIIWHGHSCFQIITSQGKDNPVSLVIDPFGEKYGLKVPELTADVVLITHDHEDHNNIQAIKGNPFVIKSAGEYEIKGVYIQGIPAFHDKNFGKDRGRITIYTIAGEDIRICHLGDLGQKELFPEQIEDIGNVDVLLIPVGGEYTIGSQEAAEIVSQIEPKIVIPMHYQLPKLKIKLDGPEKFFKAMGQKMPEPLPKLSIKQRDLVEEETKIILLKT